MSTSPLVLKQSSVTTDLHREVQRNNISSVRHFFETEWQRLDDEARERVIKYLHDRNDKNDRDLCLTAQNLIRKFPQRALPSNTPPSQSIPASLGTSDAQKRLITACAILSSKALVHYLNCRAAMGVAGHRHDTALLIAVKKNNAEIVEFLLEKVCVSPCVTDSGYTGYVPLHIVCMKPHLDERSEKILNLLLANGARVDQVCTSRGRTPLQWAAEKGNLVAMSILLEYGADPWAKTKNGETILHTACKQRNAAVAKQLWDFSLDRYGTAEHHRRVLASKLTDYPDSSHGTLLKTAAQRRSGGANVGDWRFVANLTEDACRAIIAEAEQDQQPQQQQEDSRRKQHLRKAAQEELRKVSDRVLKLAIVSSLAMFWLPSLVRRVKLLF